MAKSNLKSYRTRRLCVVILSVVGLSGIILANPSSYEEVFEPKAGAESESQDSINITNGETNSDSQDTTDILATDLLAKLEVKGRAPKTGYNREAFYSSWPKVDGCNLRQRILRRELGDSAKLDNNGCTVIGGEFDEPYTGKHMIFNEKSELTSGLQIDHVVALSDAWQKGAQYMTAETRFQIATDPLNLLAVDSKTNQGKSDGDAATWLPPNKAFRCAYVARQVSVKYKYGLWITEAEHDTIARILQACPNEPAIGIEL